MLKRTNIQRGLPIDYPQWICRDCGVKHGKKQINGHVSTWHNGTCDICKAEREVTEPRDFGHLKEGWDK
jgi:hypothetical protein